MKRNASDSNEPKKLKTNKQTETNDKEYLDLTNGKTAFESFISSAENKISLDSFLSDYWEKKPLIIKRSADQKWLDYIKTLFSLDQLKQILENNSSHKIKYEKDINLCKLVDGSKKSFNKKGLAKLAHVINSFENDKATIQFHQPQRFNVNLLLN